jgi:hypothetical protein
MNNMKPRELPLLMTAPMVRALLNGTKTQTRRAVKFQKHGDGLPPIPDEAWIEHSYEKPEHGNVPCLKVPYGHGDEQVIYRHFPRFEPGMRAWVKETFGSPDADHPLCKGGRTIEQGMRLVYRANPSGKSSQGSFVWRPSIFMPRWASRITLEITEVRVERLQSISEEDAIAEGIDHDFRLSMKGGHFSCVGAYADLWDSINGKGSWNANPWCWCISFRVLENKI